MNCALSPKQQKLLLQKVYKDLQRMAESENDFVITDYIKSFHDSILKAKEDPKLALEYAQLIPEFMNLAMTGRKDLVKSLRNKGLSRDALEDTIELFEDLDNVQAVIKPVVANTQEEVKETLELIQEEEEKPTEPVEVTPEKVTKKTNEAVFHGKAMDVYSTTGQEALVQGISWEQARDKNPEEAFYYDFFDVFADALSDQKVDAQDIEINGHKGFKLAIVSKSQIPLDKARPDEAKLVAGERGVSAEDGSRMYYGGIGAVVTDNEGNILYFDKNYNVVSQEEGMPVYHNMRVATKEKDGSFSVKGYQLQGIDTVIENTYLEKAGYETLDAFKKGNPNAYAALWHKLNNRRNSQLEVLHNLRNYLKANREAKVVTDIVGVSRGILNIEKGAGISSQEINWDKSDVKFNIHIQDIKDADDAGALYLQVPQGRPIPFQKNNLSDSDVENILSLLFDDVKHTVRGKKTSVSGAIKKRLLRQNLYMSAEGISVISNNNTPWKVMLRGKNADTYEDPKAAAREILTQKAVSQAGHTTVYNTRTGQYKLEKPKTGSTIEEFSIQNGELVITKVPFEEHVKKNTTLEILVGEDKTINYLNGYFRFNFPIDEKAKFMAKEKEEVPAPKEIEKEKPTPKVKATKAKEAEKADAKMGKGRLGGFELYANKSIEMNSTPEAIAAAEKWFNDSPLSKYVGYQEMYDVVNSNAWAQFSDATITLFKGSDKTALYHEAWHAFSQHFLTKEEKTKLYGEVGATSEGAKALGKAAIKKGGDRLLTEKEKALVIEELIAEDFRQYMLSNGQKVLGGRPHRNTLFRRIMKFLKEIFGRYMDHDKRNLTNLYEQLRTGNINQYSPSEKNAFFTESPLYKKIEAVEGKSIDIDEQDSMLIVQSIDAIVSDIIDSENEANGNTMFTSALFTQPEVKMPNGLSLLENTYNLVKEKIEERKDQISKEIDEAGEVEAERLLNKYKLLQNVLDNWGDLTEGVVAFHVEKSPYLSDQLKNIDKDTFEKTRADIDAVRFDAAGNDLSMMDLASNQVLHLVKSIKEYDENNKPALNELGFNKLVDYRMTWKKLIDTLQDNNNSPKEIYRTLLAASEKEFWMNDLLNKLGDYDTMDASSFDLWTNFWAAFYLANWGLYQVSVNQVALEEGESDQRFEVLVGYASAVFRQVEKDFKNEFKMGTTHPFIVDTGQIGNVLDYTVLDKYKGKLKGNEFEFLRDIGFFLTDTPEIRAGLNNVRVDHMYNTLQRFQGQNAIITDVIDSLRKGMQNKIKKDGKTITEIIIPSEASNINTILNLQARYSGLYANTPVTTADGKTKFEQSRMSTLAVLEKTINSVDSFQDLIALPHMQHLSYDNNPAIRASVWMKSIFEYNEETKTFGKKRPGVKFKIDDLSGTQNIVENAFADLNYSTSTAKADRYTRLLQDIYSGLLGGRFSTMVHADKSTTLSMYVTEVNTGAQSEISHLYVDPSDFLITTGEDSTLAMDNIYNMLMPYLDAELTRIAKVKAGDVPHIPGYTSKGGRGEHLTIFDGVFQPNTIEAIEAAGSVANLTGELQDQMYKDMQTYFRWSIQNTSEALGRMNFMDDNMYEFLNKNVKHKTLTYSQAKSLMLQVYTANVFLHHIEGLNLIYGDLAQYNMKKEDFHKRNAAVASTGRMFRTDQDAYNYVNNVLGRPFQEKTITEGKGVIRSAFDGTLNTAVLEETNLPSKMVGPGKPYTEAIIKNLMSKGMSKKDATEREKVINNAYYSMDEGDAQGWMSFDTYRILGKLEGRWTKAQEALFQSIVKDPSSINLKDVSEYFPPRKYQYFGPLAAEGVSTTAFHKYSLFPLVPSVVQGKNMEILHTNMMRESIDYAVHNSGSKVATITADGNMSGDKLYSDIENRQMAQDVVYTKNTIYINYLKDQLDVNSHFKGKVIFSTQLRKLIEEGLIEGGVPVDFMTDSDINTRRDEWAKISDEAKRMKKSPMYAKYKNYENKISKYIEFRKAELRRELGSTEKELAEGKGNMSKLVKFITKELDRQDLSDHEIDFIKVDSKGKLVHDLSISLSAAKIERSLNAIVNNRLIRQKVNGEPLVQLASTMMEATNPTEEQKASYGTNDLQSYRVDPKTGKTLAMEVKVALQGKFEDLIHIRHKDGKKVMVYRKRVMKTYTGKTKVIKEIDEQATLKRLNETIQDPEWRANKDNLDLITMVGVRIPVQGLNSMEFMAVKEFLPKEAGNVIVPPSEMVAKSGSDFDIDKLTIMMPNISLINGTPEVIREVEGNKDHAKNLNTIDELQNKLKELRKEKETLTKANNEAYEALKTEGLSEEDAASLAEIKNTYKEKRKELNAMYAEAQNVQTKLFGKDNLTSAQVKKLDASWDVIEKVDNERDILFEEFKADTKAFGTAVRTKQIEDLHKKYGVRIAELKEEIAQLTRKKEGLGASGIENSMTLGIRDILEMPHNFVSLITPNDTNLVMPLAKELSEKRSYKAKNGAFGMTESTSPTRVLEPAYNIYKHESNAVGKETLGLGAVDNTYNTIFNRIGAFMNPTYYTRQGKKRRATILLNHNKMVIKSGAYEGEEGISLSHLYSKDGTKIADIINQLMNGWVDVAKDAWIFDIQGNKQVSPVLMFLIQAGVPLNDAVYFVSNPLVKAYVEEQKIATSAFAKALGEAPADIKNYRTHAKDKVLAKLGMKGLKGDKLYKQTLALTKLGLPPIETNRIKDLTLEQALIDKTAKGAFLHYLELEELAKGVRDIKMKLSYDTSKSTTLFDAQKREADLKQLYADGKIPNEVIDSILNESPIGAFRIAPFQLELWGPLFTVRNHTAVNNFLIEKLSDLSTSKNMSKVYADQERYVEEFKNDLIVKMFTEAIKKFDINQESYKGLAIKRDSKLENVEHLNRGVAITKDGTIHVDKIILDTQFDKGLYHSLGRRSTPIQNVVNKKFNYDTLGLAPVNEAAFKYVNGSKKSEYYRFAIEREVLRYENPFSKMSKTHYFKHRLKVNQQVIGKIAEETKEQYADRLLKTTYEQILRDQALDNILNYWKLFKSDYTFADQMFEAKEMNPSLAKDYSIVNDFIVSVNSNPVTNEKLFINLALRDNRVDRDTTNIYYQNIKNLADKDINSIPIGKEQTEADYAENARIAELFQKLPLIAFLQSGLSAADPLSMVKFMPTEPVVQLIDEVYDEVLGKLDNEAYLNDYYTQFNNVNSAKRISKRRRLKEYARTDETVYPDYKLVNLDIVPDHRLALEFEGTYDAIASGEKTGDTRAVSNVKKGDIIEFYKTYTAKNGTHFTRSTTVKVTSDPVAVSNKTMEEWMTLEGPAATKDNYKSVVDKGYVQFKFEVVDIEEAYDRGNEDIITIRPKDKNDLESLIKNNPNVIFVLEGAESQEGFFVEGIGRVNNFDNVVGITLRKASSSASTSLWNKQTKADNMKMIDESLDAIENLKKEGVKIVMLDKAVGYGSYLIQPVKPGSAEMVDSTSFNHLSKELYRRFGYTNKFGKALTDVQKMMEENNKNNLDYILDVPYDDIQEARERLTCKI